MRRNNFKYIIGIDEVGRGPLAGPVAVCAFKMPVGLNVQEFGPIKDSKKLKPKQREDIFLRLKYFKKDKQVDYFVSYESAKCIDKIGISKAIKKCIDQSLEKLNTNPKDCVVLLDGGLKAPILYKNQSTIIKGDEKERAIAFASIVAKVSRDALMCRLAKKYPKYFFEINKGYGTEKHCCAIRKNGLCAEHRRCFCKNFLK